MNIGVDSRTLKVLNNGMGVERTLRNLLSEWCRFSDDNKYFLISDDNIGLPDDVLNSPKVEVIISRNRFIKKPLYWENITLPKILKRCHADLLFSPAYKTTLTFINIPRVVLIHDISYRVLHKDYTFKHRTMLNLYSFLSSKVARKVITDSNYSKSEIIKYYSVPEGKIISIPLGLEDHFFIDPVRKNAEPLTVGNEQIAGKYILYVGTMFERRHIKELINAYRLFLERNKEYKMVLVGENKMVSGYDLNKELNDINALANGKLVYHFNRVNEPELLALYQGCSIFAYLSSYEGFGFPPLEAMASGKPVITGNRTSIPEVVGNGAICVDPSSVKEVYEAIIRITEDRTFKEDLCKRAVLQAKKYRWDKTAKEYLKVFDKLVHA